MSIFSLIFCLRCRGLMTAVWSVRCQQQHRATSTMISLSILCARCQEELHWLIGKCLGDSSCSFSDYFFYKTDMIYLTHVYFLSEVIMCAGKQSITVWNSFSMPLNPARGDRWDDMFMFCVCVCTVKKECLDHIVLLISDSVTWSRVWLPVFPAACRRSPWRRHSFRGWLSRSCPAQGCLDQ